MMKKFLPALALLALMPAVTSAGLVTVRSGNGVIGGTDSAITFLGGPINNGFTAPLNAGNLTSAAGGPAAFVIPNNSNWAVDLGTSAKWIGPSATSSTAAYTNAGQTALYAVNFNVGPIQGPTTLTFTFIADNYIGGNPADGTGATAANAGLFINGNALAGSTLANPNFFIPSTLTFDISSFVTSGNNTLYINQTNTGGWSGLIFDATINSAVPEPSTVLMGGTAGLFGLIAYRRRKRAAV